MFYKHPRNEKKITPNHPLARQLVESAVGIGADVILGGGRANFRAAPDPSQGPYLFGLIFIFLHPLLSKVGQAKLYDIKI